MKKLMLIILICSNVYAFSLIESLLISKVAIPIVKPILQPIISFIYSPLKEEVIITEEDKIRFQIKIEEYIRYKKKINLGIAKTLLVNNEINVKMLEVSLHSTIKIKKILSNSNITEYNQKYSKILDKEDRLLIAVLLKESKSNTVFVGSKYSGIKASKENIITVIKSSYKKGRDIEAIIEKTNEKYKE